MIDWTLTSMTGADAIRGFAGQDPEIFAWEGTFTVTGGSGTPAMAAIGKLNGGYETFLTASGAADGGPGELHSSFVNLQGDIDPSIVENGNPSSTSGSASSIYDTWYTTPTAAPGPAGGIEPGQDPNKLTLADGGSDPYAVSGLLAEFLVNPGANLSFTGLYADYANSSNPGAGTLISIPEPSAATLLLGGIGMLRLRRKSKHHRSLLLPGNAVPRLKRRNIASPTTRIPVFN